MGSGRLCEESEVAEVIIVACMFVLVWRAVRGWLILSGDPSVEADVGRAVLVELMLAVVLDFDSVEVALAVPVKREVAVLDVVNPLMPNVPIAVERVSDPETLVDSVTAGIVLPSVFPDVSSEIVSDLAVPEEVDAVLIMVESDAKPVDLAVLLCLLVLSVSACVPPSAVTVDVAAKVFLVEVRVAVTLFTLGLVVLFANGELDLITDLEVDEGIEILLVDPSKIILLLQSGSLPCW